MIKAQKETPEDQFNYYKLEGEGVVIKKYLGSASSVVIPEEIDGMKVTKIGSDAFIRCTSLDSITIPNSVTSIGDNAFNYRVNIYIDSESKIYKQVMNEYNNAKDIDNSN